MIQETYIVMKGTKIVGYVQAYSTYHALRQAEKMYGQNLIVERMGLGQDNLVGAKNEPI